MTDKNLSQEVLETIKDKKITITPKWQFRIKNFLIWSATVFSLLISSLSLAVMAYMLRNNDWALHSHFGMGKLKFIFSTFPYFWLVFLIIFILLAYYIFKKTKKGYRYAVAIIIVASLVANILLGVLFYGIGWAGAVEDALFEKAPFYRKVLDQRTRMWNKPQQGFLGGKILEIKSNEEFKIKDFNNQEWEVRIKAMQMRGKFVPQSGLPVKLMGEKLNNHFFEAKEMWLWRPHALGKCPFCPAMKEK